MEADARTRKTIQTIVVVCKREMEKVGLFGACLAQSLIISLSLTGRGIRNQVIVGYLVFPGDMAIRHVWVHAFPGGIVDLITEHAAPLSPSYYLELPKGCDLLDKDADNIEEHRALESMLDRICMMKGSTRVVIDYETALRDITKKQPLWTKIIETLGC